MTPRDRRIPPRQAPAALRLRRGEPPEGGSARARRRHHRSRHGQSGHADAAAHRRQAGRDGRQAAHQPLLGLQGHPGPAPRAGRLLRAPLRREAQSRDAGRRHAGLQGGLRQHGAGHHGAGRRDPGAEPDLSDPRVRLHHLGRRHPPHSRGRQAADRRSRPSSCAASSGPCKHSIPKPLARGAELSRPTRRR